jgi:cell division initiation protein
MRITPTDIREQQFSKRLRGCDAEEVAAFLEAVAEDYEAVVKENALLREELSSMEERARNLTEHERTLQDTLVTAHRLTEDMKASSKREAQLVLREAELAAEKVMEEARAEEARIRADILAIKRVRRQLVDELRATLNRYDRMLAREGAIADEPVAVDENGDGG